ncbi:MAG: PQQ-binding-like beta-propeller repeat protein [Gammaproteobacteria bacterium]|nr:PQQ-binding-like beta-propeller repeat protein [Gammaproteobacteria bacterium]MDH4254536.1 PQQ-binding-like beta-propeller repeat protein [Gammaproteobacteria bacterium]MDH5311060.1 PQQ-binding-like beta-propeller repeat protein [Gammaproteobacteria bacterium]
MFVNSKVPAVVRVLVLFSGCAAAPLAVAQQSPGTQDGEWHFLGGDSHHTRYSPLEQINAANFEDLEEAWVWDGASFNAASGRSTPSYIDGVLYTVAGPRRHVVAIDPATGETIWSYREPNTFRYEYSMRKDYGKGIAYGEVDGRGVIYIISPAFFLTALDAKTGEPLEGFGKKVPIEGFPETGVVDLLADLGHEFDPYHGISLERGYITSSSPPIVVGDVVVVGNSAEQGYNQSRIENVPGDILGYDKRTGEFLWKFNVLPGPGEYGHETWENDNWKIVGDISSWAPLSADQERGIVYVPTNGATIDFYGGHRPGDNLFSTTLLALDVKTGKRVWHFQMVHHDIWNYDTPTAPVLLDVNMDGRTVPIVVQVTKQSFAYTFNRETGEPIWPIEERPVPASLIPGEKLSETQPFPTKPAPYDIQGLTHDDLIDFTPELRQRMIEILEEYQIGPLFNPPLHRDNDLGKKAALWCPGDIGGVNIDGPAAADPTTGILYVTSRKHCSYRIPAPGAERDALIEAPTGTTLAQYVVLPGYGAVQGPDGLNMFKPPYSRITAIDMNTGEHLWWIPVGETSDRVKNHPALQGKNIPNTGFGTEVAPMVVTKTLLVYAGSGGPGTPYLYAVDKATGEQLARIDAPAKSSYGMMTYMHEGRQYIMLQTGPKLTAMALPDEDEEEDEAH